MKVGPQWFAVTNTVGTSAVPFPGGPVGVAGLGVTQTYLSQNISVSLTTLPVDCRGAYNKSFQLLGTFSAITSVNIQVSIDPQAVIAPATASWFTIGNLTTTPSFLIHSGNVRSFRAQTAVVSNTDSFGIVYFFDDAG